MQSRYRKRTTFQPAAHPIALLVAAGGLLGCDRNPDVITASDDKERQGTTPVEDIEKQPGRHAGKIVTVSGEVAGILGPLAFELEGPGWLWDAEVIVLASKPVRLGGQSLEQGDELIVTGTVRRAVVAELERELGWDLESELEFMLPDKPVLIASNIRKVDETARWTVDAPEGVIVGLATIHEAVDPDSLAGQPVELRSVPVRSVHGKALWVGPSHASQILVVTSDAAPNVKQDQRVDVKGTLEKMPPANEAVKAFRLSRALRDDIARAKLYIEGTAIPVEEKEARR